jgi:hypothetical protein
MAPPPPSQAGKFKPRKPAKKARAGYVITPGSAAGLAAAAARPSTVTSSTDAVGKGGRQPRGRSFHQPISQGSVFFTGNNIPAAAKKGRSRSAGARVKKDGGEGGEEEVVVGQLDVGIGASAASLAKIEKQRAKKAAAESAGDYYADDGTGTNRPSRKSSGGAAQLDYIMYDSDSDLDVESWSENALQPIQLPLPSLTYAMDQLEPEMQFAPFHTYPSSEEHSQWYLFQLPTRLPPLQSQQEEESDEKEEAKENDDAVVAAVTPDIPEVVTSPILAGGFDNALATAKAGKLGRIQVYKSGKAVLVMDGPEGKVRIAYAQRVRCQLFVSLLYVSI